MAGEHASLVCLVSTLGTEGLVAGVTEIHGIQVLMVQINKDKLSRALHRQGTLFTVSPMPVQCLRQPLVSASLMGQPQRCLSLHAVSLPVSDTGGHNWHTGLPPHCLQSCPPRTSAVCPQGGDHCPSRWTGGCGRPSKQETWTRSAKKVLTEDDIGNSLQTFSL